MPSSSPKQARFMAACSHGAGYASCPPTKVSQEFNQADMRRNQRAGVRQFHKTSSLKERK